jgi:hypothetical protein
LTLQPGEPAFRIVLAPSHGFQAGDRTPTVEDEDRFAVLHLIDERTQVILGIGQGGSLHLARIANSPLFFKQYEIPAEVSWRVSRKPPPPPGDESPG